MPPLRWQRDRCLRARWRSAKPEDVAASAATDSPMAERRCGGRTTSDISSRGTSRSTRCAKAHEVRHEAARPPRMPRKIVFTSRPVDAGDGPARGCRRLARCHASKVAGRPPSSPRDVRQLSEYLIARRQDVLAATARYLAARRRRASRDRRASMPRRWPRTASARSRRRSSAWLDYLGIVPQGTVTIDNHLTERIKSTGGYNFVQGWGTSDTAESGRQLVRSGSPHSGPDAAA